MTEDLPETEREFLNYLDDTGMRQVLDAKGIPVVDDRGRLEQSIISLNELTDISVMYRAFDDGISGREFDQSSVEQFPAAFNEIRRAYWCGKDKANEKGKKE